MKPRKDDVSQLIDSFSELGSSFAMCSEDAEIFLVRLVYCTVQARMASCKFAGGSADAGGGSFQNLLGYKVMKGMVCRYG